MVGCEPRRPDQLLFNPSPHFPCRDGPRRLTTATKGRQKQGIHSLTFPHCENKMAEVSEGAQDVGSTSPVLQGANMIGLSKSFFVVGLVISSSIASAQTLGSITGEVRDPSGAVMPSASVTVSNTATNASRSTATNNAGIYVFPDLVPGTYQVRVQAAGFEPQVKTNVVLQVQQSARLDFALAVGQATQTIEVSAAAASLTTENATVGTVIENKRIEDLPLNGRNFFQLVALSPTVSYGFAPAAQALGRMGGTRSQITISHLGSRATWRSYTLA